MTERTNGEGLTLAEWLAAAGRQDTCSEYDLRAAWQAGEDPTEYRVGKDVSVREDDVWDDAARQWVSRATWGKIQRSETHHRLMHAGSLPDCELCDAEAV